MSQNVDFTTSFYNGLLDRYYPVGSVFISTSLSTATAVKNALGGGTWVAWGAGRVPVGVNSSDTDFRTVEKTGGEKLHTLSTNEMPAHKHGSGFIRFKNAWTASGVGSGNWLESSAYAWGSNTQYNDIPVIMEVGSTGGGASHNNLQPYITVYMWKRTA